MKKLLILCVFTLFNTYSFAETGKFNASGMGSWEVNVMDAGNGNMSITYDGNAGLSDKEDGSIFDKSTMHCIGGLTLTAGKFDDETGMCTFYLSDGEKDVADYMKQPNLEITIEINNGNKNFTCYTMDFTQKYISINSDYRS